MALHSSTVTKSSLIAAFHDRVRSYVANRIQYHSGNIPSSAPSSLRSAMGSSYLSTLSPSSISGTNITASFVVSAIRTVATDYTRVRRVSWTNYHQKGTTTTYADGSSNKVIESTTVSSSGSGMAALTSSYTQSLSGYTIDTTITRGHLIEEPFFNSLISAWNSLSSNTISASSTSYTNYTQYSSHSSGGGRAKR